MPVGASDPWFTRLPRLGLDVKQPPECPVMGIGDWLLEVRCCRKRMILKTGIACATLSATGGLRALLMNFGSEPKAGVGRVNLEFPLINPEQPDLAPLEWPPSRSLMWPHKIKRAEPWGLSLLGKDRVLGA